jgi:hypothetical protein
MAAVYVNNLVVNAGTDFTQTFTLEATETNSVLNLSNYCVSAKMRKWSGSSTAINFTTSIDGTSAGTIIIRLTAQQTENLKPGRYVYDVLLTNSTTNAVSRFIEGIITVTPRVTT